MSRPANAHSVMRRYVAGSEVDNRAAEHDKRSDVKFGIEKRTGPMQWVRTGSAPNLAAAQRHAAAIGGHVRARRVRSDVISAEWIEGELIG